MFILFVFMQGVIQLIAGAGWRGRLYDRLYDPGRAGVPCALGRGGVRAAKREGDGATPQGVFALRGVFYRPDRLPRPRTGLPVHALGLHDFWCENPQDPRYNRLVRAGARRAGDRLRRADGLFDLFAVIGYNDAPVRKGAGSAIFIHAARRHFGPTDGCIALRPRDLAGLLAQCGPKTRIRIR